MFLSLLLLSSQVNGLSASAATILPEGQRLKKHVSQLVDTEKPRNFENTEILDSVAQYIRHEFDCYGFSESQFQSYSVKETQYHNVVAAIGPPDSELIVIGAHYDVYGELPGADDNASGIAGLLECARLIAHHKEKLKKRVEFVAYTLEEPPFFGTRFMGSYVHATSLVDSQKKVKCMICLEMIGYFSDEKNSQDYPLGFLKPFYGSKGDYIACVSNFRSGKYARKLNKIFTSETGIKSKCLTAPGFLTGIDFSDHRNYWGYKIPALMITDSAFYRNKKYHTAGDTIDRLDFDKMVHVVEGTVAFILQLQ
jgi:Zn-dependent M28 family amino/carboxypeptidase